LEVTAAGLLEPVEHLCRRIDLIVVLAIGEHAQLVQVFREPRCFFRQMQKAVLDHRGLGVHAPGEAGYDPGIA
jgi:hypothetical protein